MGRLTNAEKIRRFRNKRKDDVAYRNSESKRVEKCRKACVDEMSEFEKGEYKIKLERDRESAVLKRKQGKKTQTSPPCASSTPLPNINPYNTKQSCGKVVTESRKALTMSPRKKLAVVAELISHVGLNLETKMERNRKNLRGLSEKQNLQQETFSFHQIFHTPCQV